MRHKERVVRRYWKWVEHYQFERESIDALYNVLQQQMFIAGAFGYLHSWVKMFETRL